MFFKNFLLILIFFTSMPSLADTSHAYANAVLDALQKKGILSLNEVADIKQQALNAETEANLNMVKPKKRNTRHGNKEHSCC